MHTKRLPQSICVPIFMLIAQAVFLLESGHRVTDAIDHPIPCIGYASHSDFKLLVSVQWIPATKRFQLTQCHHLA